jgi:predicted metal-dependent phosphoesterase TrpH
MKRDFHMHTFLSDGEPSPQELVQACIDLNLDEISITDHDALGAYPAVFDIAKGSNLRIVPGAELDCTYGNLELHMLAFGVDIQNKALNDHLAQIQKARKVRAAEQAEAINRYYARKVIQLDEICARCQTFMNPHLIHAMIDQGLFDDYQPPDRYKAAQQWMKQNIQVDSIIVKPSSEAMIKLIHQAGGIAVLAHAAYYSRDGLQGAMKDVNAMISNLKDMGMDGMEVVYPYCQEGSREFPTMEDERAAILMLREFALYYGLQETTGSDAHHIDQLRAYHSRS